MSGLRVPCGADPELMYDPAQVPAAKAVCARCPARDVCLALALESEEPWGVWGGLTEAERGRHTAGQPISRCTQCHLDFVPAHAGDRRCDVCAPAPTHDDRDDVEEIRRLAADGWTDKQIGDLKGLPRWKVWQTRRDNGIPSRLSATSGGQMPKAEQDLQPCGTDAAARRHRRRSEPLDEACRAAERRAGVEKRAAARKRALTNA